MSRLPKAMRVRFGLALFLASAVLTLPVYAQRDKPPAVGNPPATNESVKLPEDVQARQRLAAAHDYIKVQSWGEATRSLQVLLDARADSFRRVTYRDKRGKAGQRWTSIRAEAEQLLADLPKAGKDFYLLTYEPSARKAFEDAHRDPAALQEVARRYRFTTAGVEAMEWLGSYYLDRGQTELAAACFQRLLRYPGGERLTPLTLFKATLAAGNSSSETWKKLVERLDNDGLHIGSETYDSDKLRQIVARWPTGATDNWSLYRGDLARSTRGQGDLFLLEPHWRIATADGEARQWLAQAARMSQRLVLPAATPVARDGKLIFRAADGVQALDAQTGRALWRRPSPSSLEAVLRDPGKKVQMRNWLRLYGPAQAALIENATLGTLSSDGRRVYAVEDLPLPPPPDLLQNDTGIAPKLGPLRHSVGHNRLRALDANSGKIVWEIGGPASRTPKADNILTEAYFLGPPLPLGGQVFALVEKQQELNLVCLDADRGTLRWAQILATAREKMLQDVMRHTEAAHLAYADGILVCPTHSGAVLGVDPMSRSLLWAFTYPRNDQLSTGNEEGDTTLARPQADWKGCAPIVEAGRIVFTPPDSDGLFCLHLHDGSLVWKATRTQEDLYVGCVHKDTVLLIGKTTCRALSLRTGETLWRRPTGLPSGQGVAAGSIYYLPLKQGEIVALNLEKPDDSVRQESRAVRGDLGNLVFHRGILWSQNATELLALTPLTRQLARLEERLADAPGDPSILFERGRLRLSRGDTAGAAADLHDALAHHPPSALRPMIREPLFAALTQLLQHDFAAGEKYLDEYKALCQPTIPASASAERGRKFELERGHRQMRYLALLALGREKQGRVVDALQAYQELSRKSGTLMTPPDDPALQTRPDLWAQGRIAALLTRASPQQRALLCGQVEQQWQSVASDSDRPSLRHFVTMFGAIEGEEAPRVQEARLRLATRLAQASGPRHALEAELLLGSLSDSGARGGQTPLAARALYEQALLLTRHGLLDEAVACYRRLAQEHADTVIHEGKTGAQLLDEVRSDKRFLATVEPKVDPWTGAKLKAVVLPRGLALHPLRIPCVPCRIPPRGEMRPLGVGVTSLDPLREVPRSCRHLRFTLDGSKLQLRVAERNSGAELYSISLPLISIPSNLNGEVCYQVIDHLLVLCVGPTLLGVDLLERRVRWSRHVVEGNAATASALNMLADGGFLLNALDARLTQRLGLIGPIGRRAVCVKTPRGLTALDPASGEVCWERSDVAHHVVAFGDEDYLFLVEQSGEYDVRGIHAVRLRDGMSVPIPDATACCAGRRRILGRHLLVVEPGMNDQLDLRLHDPLTGRDVWRKTAPAGSFLLQSPEPRWLGIVEPKGIVKIVDLAQREEVARLVLDARHLRKVRNGYLLTDRERFYLALQGPMDPDSKIVDEPSANFHGGLTAVPVNGMLYAFERTHGKLCWFSWLPPQMLLLDQFADLPILLCSAVGTYVSSGTNNPIAVVATRSLDKRTGKLLYNGQVAVPNGQAAASFHALQMNAYSGAIDLISPTQKLRHMPVGRGR